MKKLTLLLAILALPVLSFAAISEQDKANFLSKYNNGKIKTETYNKILDFCDKNDTDIESCMSKLKVQASALSQNQVKSRICCLNVSGFVGEYAYIRGQGYCIPPC